MPSESITICTSSCPLTFHLEMLQYKLWVWQHIPQKYSVISCSLDVFTMCPDWHGEHQGSNALLSPDSSTSKSLANSPIRREKGLPVIYPHTRGGEFVLMGACTSLDVFIILEHSFWEDSTQWFSKGNFITVNEKSLTRGEIFHHSSIR